jgi:predicted benzoate:H+ symporter BenE
MKFVLHPFRRHSSLVLAAGFLPSTLLAHDLDAQGAPMPTWLVVAGLALIGSVGGAVFLVLKNHRRSLEARRGNQTATPPQTDTPSR